MNTRPQGHDLTFIWTEDGTMKPIPSQLAVAQKRFKVGESYRFRPDRIKGRGGFFKKVKELWEQLPEQYGARWKTPDALRHAVMIELGYCDHQDFVLDDQKAALRLASYMRQNDPYCVVKVRDNVVTRWSAWSQSPDHMTEQQFYDINIPILDYIRAMIGLPLLGDEKHDRKDTRQDAR